MSVAIRCFKPQSLEKQKQHTLHELEYMDRLVFATHLAHVSYSWQVQELWCACETLDWQKLLGCPHLGHGI